MNIEEPEYSCDDLTPLARRVIGPSAERIGAALRVGLVPVDPAFDRFLPYELAAVTGRFWTPLVVAACAAEWLSDVGARSVVDIGSGVGKFCVATGLAGLDRVTGIEQRPRLVGAARDLAQLFNVDDRVTFIEGAFGEVPTPEADAYYLFNPFGENLYSPAEHLDSDIELNKERFVRDVRSVEALLRGARVGTHLLTYNGFGGFVPASYREARIELNLPCPLRLWQKVRARNEGRVHSPDAI